MTRRALVTGASRGIGLEVARMLAADGWSVLGVSRTAPSASEPLPEGMAWAHQDVRQPRALRSFVSSWCQGGPLDALIHCAAIQGPVAAFLECDPDAWAETISTNLLGTAAVVRACLPPLARTDDARILLFSGGGAFGARPFHTAYAASKAGVVSLMESLADELRDTSITVNCVAPGRVPTSIHTPPLPDDGGEAMAEAVACVRHLLGPEAYGLSGKTISAPWDDWRHVSPLTVARVNASPMGTRSRHPIALVGQLAKVAV